MNRRGFILAGTAFVGMAATPVRAESPLEARLAAIEARVGGQLGVAASLGNQPEVGRHLRDPFPLCSTAKLLIVGTVLSRVDQRQEHLDRPMPVRPDDLVAYSPVCQTRMNAAMTISELCQAALTVSDNAAANLLLRAVGGPCAVTTFANRLCRGGFKLDRTEPRLNEVAPGELRDSTTPAAMLRCMRALLLQNALSPASRLRLQDWLKACQTGTERLRAGLPRGWIAGDKTGSWSNGRIAHANDIAIAWAPAGAAEATPLLIAAYLKFSPASPEARNAALAETAQAVSEHFRL